MLDLIKSEIEYEKKYYLVFYGTIILSFILAAVWDFIHISMFVNIAVTAYVAVIIVTGIEYSETKRERLFRILPVTVNAFGLFRILFLHISLVAITLLSLLLFLLKKESAPDLNVWIILSSYFFMSAWFTMFEVYHDLGFYDTSKYKKIFWATLFVVVIIIGVFQAAGMLLPALRFLGEHALRPTGAFSLAVLMVIVSLYSFTVFIRRKSYLG